MEIIPEVHLEDWDANLDETEFTKGKLMISIEKDIMMLSISDIDSKYRKIKEIKFYWELQSLDYFLNADINSDSEQDEYQREFSSHIRSSYLYYDYLIINKKNNSIYGINDLFDYNGWTNKDLERLWHLGNIDIIDVNDTDDVCPLILETNGWSQLTCIDKDEIIAEYRDLYLEDILL